MDLTIVNISDGALLRISDLMRNSEKLAYLVNELDSISYKEFYDAFMFDKENSDEIFVDPACFVLK